MSKSKVKKKSSAMFRAILAGSQIPMGQLIYEVLVPFSGSGIALAEQIIREEGAGILPFWYVIPFIAKSALWITVSFMVERRMSW